MLIPLTLMETSQLQFQLKEPTQILTKSVILNCPNLKRIKSYHQNYKDIDVKFFGKISFLAPLLNKFLGGAQTEKISNYVDKLNYLNGLSFKFVMVAVKK